MSRIHLSFSLLALCAACGSDFQASSGDGAGGNAGSSDRAGSAGTVEGDAGDSSVGGSGDAGDAGETSAGGSGQAGSGQAGRSNGGSGGVVSVGGSGGTVASGGTGGTTSTGGGGGTDNTCATLRTEYAKLVDAARACTVDEECSTKSVLPAPTACGCAVLVNQKANTEKAQAKYQELEKNGCLKGVACPNVVCPVNTMASCDSVSGSKALVCTGSGLIKG